MTYENFHLDIDTNGVATLLIDRAGESMNTLGVDLLRELATVLDRLEAEDVRAVVIGSAKKDFLAGADIRMFAEFGEPDDAIDGLKQIHELFARVEALHRSSGKPVVAAIHGACLGRWLGTCADCIDTYLHQLIPHPARAARGSARPHSRSGRHAAPTGTRRSRAGLEMIVGGQPVRPRKAKSVGLVDEVVPTEVLMDVAVKRATEAIEAPPPDRVIALECVVEEPPTSRPRTQPCRSQGVVQEGNVHDARQDRWALSGAEACHRGDPHWLRTGAGGRLRGRTAVLRRAGVHT